MSNKQSLNPLYDTQREKSGSQTFDKYLYQYHWALYKVITEHEKLNEYAVIIELHEDVVISNSLDGDKAQFDFNQVKNTKTPYNTYQLVKKKDNGSSVLGKLIQSGINKPYSKKIKNANLIATNKFKLSLNKEGVELQTITKEDLTDGQITELESELKKEIGISSLPTNIQFILTDLPDKVYQTHIIGLITVLINKMFPGSYSNAEGIYTVLIDELYRKGRVDHDFKNWDDLIKNKALTSIQVSKAIAEFTNLKDESSIEASFTTICREIGLKVLQTKTLKQSFDRYRRERISNKSTLQIDTTKNIIKAIQLNMMSGVDDIASLIENVKGQLPPKTKSTFTSNEDIDAAIICEYIMM